MSIYLSLLFSSLGCVNNIISEAEKKGLSGFRTLDSIYPKVAKMLSIDQSIAAAYVSPLGQTKFDKSVGSILMNADLAVSMPDMGGMFREQIKELAEDVLMTSQQGDERTTFLAAAGTVCYSALILLYHLLISFSISSVLFFHLTSVCI